MKSTVWTDKVSVETTGPTQASGTYHVHSHRFQTRPEGLREPVVVKKPQELQLRKQTLDMLSVQASECGRQRRRGREVVGDKERQVAMRVWEREKERETRKADRMLIKQKQKKTTAAHAKRSKKIETAIRANRSQAHLSLVVVQVKVLGVLLLPIPPPPLGRGAPLGPSRAEKNTPLSYERKWEEKKRAQNEKRRRGLWCEALTCCWWARWTERQTAAEGRSLVRSGPGRSSCPAGGGAERCGRSLPPSSRWLSLQKKRRRWDHQTRYHQFQATLCMFFFLRLATGRTVGIGL